MLKPIIIIDLDGPILDGKQRHYQCYCDILKKHNYDPIHIDQYWELKVNKIDRRKLLELSKAHSIYDKFFQDWLQNIELLNYLEFDVLQSKAIETLEAWQKKNHKIVLVTMRNNKENLFWQLEKLNLERLFHEILVVGSENGMNNKADSIAKLIPSSNFEHCLWIGDTEADINAAQKLGIEICAVEGGLRTRKYLESLEPNYFANSISSIK